MIFMPQKKFLSQSLADVYEISGTTRVQYRFTTPPIRVGNVEFLTGLIFQCLQWKNKSHGIPLNKEVFTSQ